MSMPRSNQDVTIDDFNYICRTCLSTTDLNKFSMKTSLVDMLRYCTVVKFTEADGLPMQICINCIQEINQAFKFAKRCETTDIILWNCITNRSSKSANNSFPSQEVEPVTKTKEGVHDECVQKIKQEEDENKTELASNSFPFLEAESIIKVEEINIEIKQEVIIPNISQTVNEDLGDDEYSQVVKQEEAAKIEFTSTVENVLEELENVEQVTQEENVDMDNDCNETDNDFNETDNDFNETDNDSADETFCLPKDQRNQHKNVRHSNDRVNQCQPSKLKRHRRRKHTVIGPHTCEVCRKTFTTALVLEIHMRIHTGERPYNCEVCSKSFNQSQHLKDHMRSHTGDRPYICEFCNKKFIRSGSLSVHKRLHIGVKPYNCEVCSKKFTRIGDLQKHMRIHTGEKPYTCKVCSKSFIQSPHLKEHLRIHTGEKLCTCEVCGKTFSKTSNLKCHMKIHTREQIQPPPPTQHKS